ncbi:S8 family serine peptidase [Nitrosospira sp. Nsp1]|uniref:S8 family serine peptidase n=1 Tax=Nitrosospira sp. Nsp1 TaxID=136547 RepID=UPI00087F9798|nr:S8 family serine peptidase [Nitrosospira sp. Nsp1]SCX56916.1 Serine protease, subtilisin family [Nitrosospira sp. Nsp1]
MMVRLPVLLLSILVSSCTIFSSIHPDKSPGPILSSEPSGTVIKTPSSSGGDYYFTFDKKIPIEIVDNAIAVLAREGRVDAAKKIGLAMQFTLMKEYDGGLLIFALPRRMNREEIVNLSRELPKRSDQSIGKAGFVVSPAGSKTFMLLSDEFVVQFRPDAKPEAIKKFNADNAVAVVMKNPYAENQYLLTVTSGSEADALEMANRYQQAKELVEFAHPNFIRPIEVRETVPNDTLFPNQWHHRNTGQSGGTVDADVDTSWAWDINQGAPGTVIAVIDGGFDLNHPDLAPNLWVNPVDVPNGADDDGNNLIDDINGWDFTACDATPGAGCGDNNPTGPDTNFGRHGTAVAGSAAARGNNALGVTGSCPNCSLMLIRIGGASGAFSNALAFGYAQQSGAAVITNSWGYAIGGPVTAAEVTAINNAATLGRGGLGSVVFFAMNNPNVNDCIGVNPDISSLASVIAISRATNRDQFDFSGFGNCMDLLAPSAGLTTVTSGRGTLWATTTDMVGAAGYNNNATSGNCPTVEAGPPPANARDYTACFNGTSFATPLTAGIGGLVLSSSPTLTRIQVQQLLQDTADRIEDSTGSYADTNGFSSPAAGHATHGFGRVNAFEAVRVAAPSAQGGRAGVDIFLRDNRLDWGNTEQPSNTSFEPTRGFIGHWQSMDIKVDKPPYEAMAPTAANFDAFPDETPSGISGEVNRVYVRVRNRGPAAATSVTVKLLWSQFGTALPPLPSDFWTAFPGNSADTTEWHPLNCMGTATPNCGITNLAYSGSTVAGTGADAGQVVVFDFPAPSLDPARPNHFCLLAIVDSPQDSISANSRASSVVDVITPTDNNVTHRNYSDIETGRGRNFGRNFYVRNPHDFPIRTRLRVNAPAEWLVELDKFGFDVPFELKPREQVLVSARTVLPKNRLTGEVHISQERFDGKRLVLMGGVTLGFAPKILTSPPTPTPDASSSYLVGAYDLRGGSNTVVRIINPASQPQRLFVAFFDNNNRPLYCTRETLPADASLELDVRRFVPKRHFGIVKVLALDANDDHEGWGIVGNQQSEHKLGMAETPLHPMPRSEFAGEYPRIREMCR